MDDCTATRHVVITNPQGLHARPADLFVRLANTYQATIEIVKDRQRVDGKSILNLLMLAAEQGTTLELVAIGPDAEEALNALSRLIERDFQEPPTEASASP
jgi:phosphotransferase system HPr (HPr) family protein